MLSLSQIKAGKTIVIDGQPHSVLANEHSKMGRAGAVMRTKLKNLITGAVFDKTFQGADR
jgi:elongation factor P